jgi:hypothetical protein
MKQLDFVGPGTVYYAFPVSKELATWNTYAVQLLEATAGSKKFSASVDETLGDWLVFDSATAPASFNLRKGIWRAPVDLSNLNSTGTRARTFTVNDGTTVLESAKIRVTKGAASYVLITNVAGIATASLDDGTWTVAITLAGYSFTPTTLVISADGTNTYSMAATSITPSTPPQTTGYWTVYDLNGTILPGATVQLRTANAPTSSTGLVLEDAIRTGTANSSGVVSFTGLFPGATYIANRAGSTRQFTITVPATAGTTVALGSIVG